MPKNKLQEKKLSPELQNELRWFFETHDAASLSRNLRCMLLDFLHRELEHLVPLYLPNFLWQLYDLFEILDQAAEETRPWHQPTTSPDNHKEKK